jgi:ABC-type branched-subunit amino acid transport system ATPase component
MSPADMDTGDDGARGRTVWRHLGRRGNGEDGAPGPSGVPGAPGAPGAPGTVVSGARSLGGGASLFPLGVLLSIQLLDQATQSSFNVLTPNVRDAFHLSNTSILLIVALAGAAALLGTVPVAWLADRTLRVPIVLVGAGVGAAFSVALGLAPTAVLLAVMLCGVYLGQAVIFPTHNSLLADYYPVEARPRVYSAHRAGLSIGAAGGVLLGAGLAAAFSWRTPFIVFALPIGIVVLIGLRLREPPRGHFEEVSLRALDPDAALDEAISEAESAAPGPLPSVPEALPPLREPPPSFGEAWRMVWKIRVLRRIFLALPFLAASIAGFTSLASLQYQETFHLGVFDRALLVAPVQVFVLLGLVVGATLGTRLAARGLHLIFRMLAVTAVVASAFAVMFALAPTVPVAFFGNAGIEGSLAIVGPGVLAALSLAIPSRVRSLGFSIGALFVVPGLVVIPIVGAVGDAVGFRYGMLMLVPVFLVGGLVVATAGSFIDEDVQDVWLGMRTREAMLAARQRGELPLLAVRSLFVGYDRVPVLRGVDFEIAEGEIVALLGTNGAGKSTLLRAIGGVVEADRGAVIFDGRDITHMPPDEIARLGIGQMPGGAGVFPTLTVEENLRLAAWQDRRNHGRGDHWHEERLGEAFGRLGVLADRRGDRAGDLSGGQQQILALTMALLAAPALLLVDELSLGLAPIVVEQLLESLRTLRAAGTAVLLVDQSVNVAVAISDRVYIMDSGAIRFSGSASEVRDHPELLWSIYVHHAVTGIGPSTGLSPGSGESGSGVPQPTPAAPGRPFVPATNGPPAQPPALGISDVSVFFGGIVALDEVSLSAGAGDVVGIIGPNGAGKTTLFDVVSGFTRPRRGEVFVGGRDVTVISAARRARLGLGRSFQDSVLFSGLSVRDTLAVALERYIDTADPFNAALRLPAVVDTEAAIDGRVDELIELFGLQRFAAAFIGELSTGTRRLVDLAAVVAHAPSVVLLDEPSSGVAQREVEAMGELLRRVQDTLRATLVIVEHDIAFVAGIADRLVALDRGRVVAEGTPDDVLARTEVVEAFLGVDPVGRARSGTMAAGAAGGGGRAGTVSPTGVGGTLVDLEDPLGDPFPPDPDADVGELGDPWATHE